jgi:hypothetical protein
MRQTSSSVDVFKEAKGNDSTLRALMAPAQRAKL